MMKSFIQRIAFAGALSLLASACTAPRSILHSPDALAKGRWQAGANMDFNIPTQTAESMYGGLENGVEALYDRVARDSVAAITADSLNDYAEALVAYSIDPLSAQTGLFVRYGILSHFDGGYHYAGGAHAFDLRWQFLGPAAGDTVAGSPWRGSVGLQYGWQSFELPSILGKLQDILSYEFKRKDILVPLILGKPFGAHGRFGSFAFGGAYNLAFIEYGSDIFKLVERKADGTTQAFAPLRGEKVISSYGGFTNIRAGYRWVYLVGSMAAYWQDYGDFELFGGRTAALSGWTYLPSLALEFRF
jgi:hypothetical protein